jgi:hypothetical protein
MIEGTNESYLKGALKVPISLECTLGGLSEPTLSYKVTNFISLLSLMMYHAPKVICCSKTSKYVRIRNHIMRLVSW